MEITDVVAVYPNYRAPLAEWRAHLWQMVVRIETDLGYVGLGCGGGGEAAVTVVNRHLRDRLRGRRLDSRADIQAIWDDLYRASIPYGRRGIALMALSGIDLALWDLLARARNVPVYALLGGLRKPWVRAYATGSDPEWFQELGFSAYKFSHRWTGQAADYDKAVTAAAQARRLLGAQALVMVDCYMSWDAAVVEEMARRLADYNIYWFEDVLTPDQLLAQARLRESVKPIHLAGGEHEFGHYGFAEVARSQALDIWQPDITWCGGITAALRILELAQEAGVKVVPHRGGEVWGLHLIAASDCEDLAELVLGHREAQIDQLWAGQPSPVEGYLIPTDAPGFGVQLNDSLL